MALRAESHPESMKIGMGRCHLHVGFPLVVQEPDAKCDAGGAFRHPKLLLRARILDSVLAGSSRRRPYFHTRCILGYPDDPSGMYAASFDGIMSVVKVNPPRESGSRRWVQW